MPSRSAAPPHSSALLLPLAAAAPQLLHGEAGPAPTPPRARPPWASGAGRLQATTQQQQTLRTSSTQGAGRGAATLCSNAMCSNHAGRRGGGGSCSGMGRLSPLPEGTSQTLWAGKCSLASSAVTVGRRNTQPCSGTGRGNARSVTSCIMCADSVGCSCVASSSCMGQRAGKGGGCCGAPSCPARRDCWASWRVWLQWAAAQKTWCQVCPGSGGLATTREPAGLPI
jgi:hypothetical protein